MKQFLLTNSIEMVNSYYYIDFVCATPNFQRREDVNMTKDNLPWLDACEIKQKLFCGCVRFRYLRKWYLLIPRGKKYDVADYRYFEDSNT